MALTLLDEGSGSYPRHLHTPMDFIFACRECQSPLVAGDRDRGAVIDCPNCTNEQFIPIDADFGSSPSTYIQEASLVDGSSAEGQKLLRRVRVRRAADGETVRAESFVMAKATLPPPQVAARFETLENEVAKLLSTLAERDRQLAEWQTCYDSVDRELTKASDRAAALQAKINATSNELAQTRHDLTKARAEADASRKANEALNHQLQAILRANQGQPPRVAPPADDLGKRKQGDKLSGELAA